MCSCDKIQVKVQKHIAMWEWKIYGCVVKWCTFIRGVGTRTNKISRIRKDFAGCKQLLKILWPVTDFKNL